MGSNGYLGTERVGELLGVSSCYVRALARKGHIPAKKISTRYGPAYAFEFSAVVDLWRKRREGRCVRCTIRGEARPELGFMCEPCAYEVETGRIWWPNLPRRTTYQLPQGRLGVSGGRH